MTKTKLIVIGGFLGAGKTTSILNMAKYLINTGKKIGIVTNDQGSQLVDTKYLASEGLSVLEVTGGCFCCNFDEFTSKVNQLAESEMPDIILAEPVGSCTDLIATIFKPLQLQYTKQFTLAPLSIIADPKRVKKLMMEQDSSLFPNEINYLFRKQLEEADIIVLNKIDLLTEKEIKDITSFLKNTFKSVDVLHVSAKNNVGIDRWASLLVNTGASLRTISDINYEIYAAAEEHLGWLNSTVLLTASAPLDMNDVVKSLMIDIQDKLKVKNYEIAHLKTYSVAESDWTKASITSIFDEVDFNKRMDNPVTKANLIINARVNTNPEILQPIVEESLHRVCRKYNIVPSYLKTECFKPGKPKPVHIMR